MEARTLLRLLSAVYLVAFASYYVQAPLLYSCDGLTPARSPIPALGLPALTVLDLAALAGAAIAALTMLGLLVCMPAYAAMWLLYGRLFAVGQVWLSFQWDVLLLEVGFVAALMAPLVSERITPTTRAGVISLRVVLFKLMLMSGLVKVQSECPTWLGLTALHYHFATQCIPTPLAWYAAQLPGVVKKLSVAATLVIEIPATFLILAPHRSLRRIAAGLQLVLQINIMLTGNYNFFNLLTCILILALLTEPDEGTPRLAPKSPLWSLAVPAVAMGLFAASIAAMFSATLDPLDLDLVQSPKELSHLYAVQLLPGAAVWALGLVALEGLCQVWALASQRRWPGAVWSLCSLLALLVLVPVSLTPMATLHLDLPTMVPKPIRELEYTAKQNQIVSGYGLFRRMTGVGQNDTVARPEVVLEASDDGESWRELHFLYKPGNVDVSPPWLPGHQARLDWQMWFAALSAQYHPPWLIHLCYKILQGSQTVAPYVRDPDGPGHPPRYLRALLYEYDFTSAWDEPAWWRRNATRVFVPPIHKDMPELKEFLVKTGVDPEVRDTCLDDGGDDDPASSAVVGAVRAVRRAVEAVASGYRAGAVAAAAVGIVVGSLAA